MNFRIRKSEGSTTGGGGGVISSSTNDAPQAINGNPPDSTKASSSRFDLVRFSSSTKKGDGSTNVKSSTRMTTSSDSGVKPMKKSNENARRSKSGGMKGWGGAAGGGIIDAAQISRGDAYVREADATLKRRTYLPSSTKGKNESAASSLIMAAEAYRVGGDNDMAGTAYVRASTILEKKLRKPTEASKCLSDAGECMKRSNPTASTRCYKSAVSLLCDAGNLDRVDLADEASSGRNGKASSTRGGSAAAPGVPAAANGGVEKNGTGTKNDERAGENDWKRPSKVGGGGKKKKKKKETKNAGGGILRSLSKK